MTRDAPRGLENDGAKTGRLENAGPKNAKETMQDQKMQDKIHLVSEVE